MRKPEIVETEDGSLTLYQADLGETYHSIHGALTESRRIFIELGLESIAQYPDVLRVLELGFGTGLNSLLTFAHCKKQGIALSYHGVDNYPLDNATTEFLHKGLKGDWNLFRELHEARWNRSADIGRGLSLFKENADIREFKALPEAYDLVYFDAFGPDTQPELWTETVFSRIAEHCSPGAILVTYSSKGSVRRAMESAGFVVEKHPGPPGKREVVRAILKMPEE